MDRTAVREILYGPGISDCRKLDLSQSHHRQTARCSLALDSACNPFLMSRSPSSHLQFLPLQPAIWERIKNGLRSEELVTASSVVSVADHDYVQIRPLACFPEQQIVSLSVPTCGRSTSEAGVNGRPFVTSSRDQRGKLWPQSLDSNARALLPHLARRRISDCIWLCGETRCRSASDSGPCSHAARLPPALDSCAGIDQFGAKYRVRQSVTGVKFDR